MDGYFILLGGMVFFISAIGIWDFFAERQARRRSLR
jgi:hypothetical protein